MPFVSSSTRTSNHLPSPIHHDPRRCRPTPPSPLLLSPTPTLLSGRSLQHLPLLLYLLLTGENPAPARRRSPLRWRIRGMLRLVQIPPSRSRRKSGRDRRTRSKRLGKSAIPKKSKLGIFSSTLFTASTHSFVTTSANTDFSDVVQCIGAPTAPSASSPRRHADR
jgi:hypothetical protein